MLPPTPAGTDHQQPHSHDGIPEPYICSHDSHFQFGSFDAAPFNSVASAMQSPAEDSRCQLARWRSVCSRNQARYPDPYSLFPVDVYNSKEFWPYPGWFPDEYLDIGEHAAV